MFDRSLYNEEQLDVLDEGLNTFNDSRGDITDIDPLTHTATDLLWFSLSRGSVSAYGPIEDFKDKKIKSCILFRISIGRGLDSKFGDISSYPYLEKLEEHHAYLLSVGKGTDPDYVDIWDIPELWLKSEDELETLNKNRLINTANLSA